MLDTDAHSLRSCPAGRPRKGPAKTSDGGKTMKQTEEALKLRRL
jgi:hypothetical protein